MQSVHVHAVFSCFCMFSSKRFPEEPTNRFFVESCLIKIRFVCEKMRSKNCFRKMVSRQIQTTLYSQAGGSQRGSLACALTDKKQLFEQQLKHCSRFLQKKVDWAQKWYEKLTGLLNRCKQTEWVAENCWLLKTNAQVEIKCWNNCWSKCTRLMIWHTLGKGPANIENTSNIWAKIHNICNQPFLACARISLCAQRAPL